MEQLHFAIGAFIPFIISFFFYDKKIILFFPLIMTFTGFFASLPFYLGLQGPWTNIFFFYGLIRMIFNKGEFIGYALIIFMFTIVLLLQVYYIWRNDYA